MYLPSPCIPKVLLHCANNLLWVVVDVGGDHTVRRAVKVILLMYADAVTHNRTAPQLIHRWRRDDGFSLRLWRDTAILGMKRNGSRSLRLTQVAPQKPAQRPHDVEACET